MINLSEKAVMSAKRSNFRFGKHGDLGDVRHRSDFIKNPDIKTLRPSFPICLLFCGSSEKVDKKIGTFFFSLWRENGIHS